MARGEPAPAARSDGLEGIPPPRPLLIQSGWTDELFPVGQGLAHVRRSAPGRPRAARRPRSRPRRPLRRRHAPGRARGPRLVRPLPQWAARRFLKGGRGAAAPPSGSIVAYGQSCPRDARRAARLRPVARGELGGPRPRRLHAPPCHRLPVLSRLEVGADGARSGVPRVCTQTRFEGAPADSDDCRSRRDSTNPRKPRDIRGARPCARTRRGYRPRACRGWISTADAYRRYGRRISRRATPSRCFRDGDRSDAWALAEPSLAGDYAMYQCRDAAGQAGTIRSDWTMTALPGGELFNSCPGGAGFGIRQTPSGMTGERGGSTLALTFRLRFRTQPFPRCRSRP